MSLGKIFGRRPFEITETELFQPTPRLNRPNIPLDPTIPLSLQGAAPTITTPAKELRTRTRQGTTGNPILLAIADAMAEFGRPGAAQRGQQMRMAQLQALEEGAERRSLQAKQEFERMKPKWSVDSKGNVTIVDEEKLLSGDIAGAVVRIEKPSSLSPAGFETALGQLEKLADIKLTGKERARMFIHYQDSVEADDITPFRQGFDRIVDLRSQQEAAEKTEERISARQEKGFKETQESQQRQFAQSEKMQRRSLEAIAERPSFTPLVNAEGKLTGAFNNRTGQPIAVRSPEEFRRGEKGSEKIRLEKNAESGLKAIMVIRAELEKNPRALLQEAMPLAPGARILRTAKKEASDVITRFRTGAALNKNEEEFYLSQLPSPFDSQETIEFKLKLLEELFSSFSTAAPKGVGSGKLNPRD